MGKWSVTTPSPPIRLFDLPDLRADEPEPPATSYGRRLTARNKRLIANGWHPATHRPLLGGDEQCRDCVHAFPTGRNVRNHWKCAKNPRGLTRGPRTDIRVSWPACTLFEPYPEEPEPVALADVEGTGVPSGDA